jgi:heme exporter protein C
VLNFLRPSFINALAKYNHLVLAVALLGLAVAGVLIFRSPIDYQQGVLVKIMYVHIPAASLAMLIYMAMAGLSLSFLVWRNPVSFFIASSLSYIGFGWTLLCLATGSLWGKDTWGTYWVWDARLTLMFIQAVIYFGYIYTLRVLEKNADKIVSYLCIITAVNIPLIKYSVDFFNTLHQGESIMSGQISPKFLVPLAVSFIGCALLTYTATVYLTACKIQNAKYKGSK